MLTAKVEIPQHDSQFWERISIPEEPDGPAIRIRKNVEQSCFDADFAIDLLGVVKGREKADYGGNVQESANVDSDQLRISLLTGLNVGQEIAFVYRSQKDEQGHSRLAWRLKGRSHGSTSEEAEHTARVLWRNLSIVTGSMGGEYRFVSVTDPVLLCTEDMKREWVGIVRPVGVAIDAGRQAPIGFTKEASLCEDRTSVIVTPHAEKKGDNGINTMVSAALCCHGVVEVVCAITPIVLSARDQKKVANALTWLNNGENKKITYTGLNNEGMEDETVLKGLQNSLGSWLKSPYGYRISCTASSDRPIPASFMALLAGIFNCPVSMTMENVDRRKTLNGKETMYIGDSDTLDLQDCIKNGSDMPDLFPRSKTLAACGVGKVFKQPLVKTSLSGILLGTMGQEMTGREVRFPWRDRSRHAYIVGATGTGKSTLLFNMIRQDIENGEGTALIDPHGDLYHQVLMTIPPKRANDVVLIDPCNFEYAVGINFLECKDFYKPAQMNFVVNEMIKIFDRLYDLRTTGGPMFEQYVRNAMFLSMENDLDRATLMDVPLIFEDCKFRDYLKKKCHSKLTVNFWNRQAETAGGEASLNNMAPYITSKLNQFTNNAILRPIIGQRESTINFREIMDEGKILLVNLSKGLLGSLDTQLLGMLVIGKILTAAMGRANIASDLRRPFFLYVDEFQNFTTDSVSTLLSESRKYGIYLTLANQTLTQLRAGKGQDVLDSVLGNAGSMMILRSGIMDSEKLEMYTKPELTAQDLQELPDFHVAGRLLVNNSPTRPFVFRTLPAVNGKENEMVEKIRTMSAMKYARPTTWVEQDILDRSKFDDSCLDENKVKDLFNN